jgi:hypothetical protein
MPGTARAPAAPARVPLADRIAALRAELVALEQQHRDEEDARFLRVIVVAVRGACFSVADLIAHAPLDADLGEALRGRRPKQLGKRLARLVDREVQGLTVRRVLLTKDGWMWDVHFNQDAGARG